MLSSNIKESSFNSTTSKHIETVLPYGKHNKGVDITKTKEDVSVSLFSFSPPLFTL